MKTVRYTGISGVREISAADFRSVGVEEQNLIRVKGRNLSRQDPRFNDLSQTVEVEDAAADWLVANDDFEITDEDPEPEPEGTPDFESASFRSLKAYARKIGMDMSTTGQNQTREQLIEAIQQHQTDNPS